MNELTKDEAYMAELADFELNDVALKMSTEKASTIGIVLLL